MQSASNPEFEGLQARVAARNISSNYFAKIGDDVNKNASFVTELIFDPFLNNHFYQMVDWFPQHLIVHCF
jgi:hypothetical protein